jgi:hypothetical protein
MEVYEDNRGQQLVHSLLVGYIWVRFAPNEENGGEKFKNLGVQEEI